MKKEKKGRGAWSERKRKRAGDNGKSFPAFTFFHFSFFRLYLLIYLTLNIGLNYEKLSILLTKLLCRGARFTW